MTARIYGPDSVTDRRDLERQALRAADVLRERGIGSGDRVLLKIENSTTYVIMLFALMHIGASIVLVDHREQADTTAETVRTSGAGLVLADDDAPLAPDTPVAFGYEIMVAAADRAPGDGHLDFEAWGKLSDSLVMWSSGSTGVPKGVAKNGARFLKNLERNAALVGHKADDVLLPLLPFNHQYGLSMVLIAWLTGASLVIAPYRRLDRALKLAGRAGATVVDTTPSTYRSIFNLIGKRPSLAGEFAHVRMLCSGAAPLEPALTERAVELFGLPLLDSYGSTEMGNVAFANLANPHGCGQVVDGLALEVRAEDGTVLPAGEIGELFVRDPDLMEGYLGADGAVRPVDRGWYATGDLGYLDADRNLFVAGRKRAVHRNGHTLHPEVIEHRLAGRGCSAKIVAVPDQRRGASLVFVVQDGDRRDAHYWREVICAVLPPFEQPNRVLVTEQFPLNRNGKPDHKRLAELAAAPSH
ncbi:class I adenylate-forming enzyme family protein [Amycolatopsis panacis]|uniref:Long-chain fatty acid--CoA ligase n=1 Tax=Amycolatopsis panacis TaxID=2340917 RepID=A0A419I1M8_9PSEU|nr:class I adenylate-forming enzyme family protein [Amycolatopsis panacis]RJQ83714.1 long-chain fatty acid--CoA ligase [Amycolatopsis panacis]